MLDVTLVDTGMGMRRQQLRWTSVAEDHMKEAREHGRSLKPKR